MSLITLTSDYGEGSPHVAQLKGAIYKRAPLAKVVDISHSIRKYDVAEAVWVLKQVAPEFPDNSVHLLCVKAACDRPLRLVKYRRQFYLGADNEAFGLLFDEEAPMVYDLSGVRTEEPLPTFPEREWFVPAAAHLMTGGAPESIGRMAPALEPLNLLPPRLEGNELVGQIVFIDHFGNAVTNISRALFEEVVGEREFIIPMRSARMDIRRISTHYHEVAAGDAVALFNASGLLEIAINNHSAPGGNGGADTLLGLRREQDVRITLGA